MSSQAVIKARPHFTVLVKEAVTVRTEITGRAGDVGSAAVDGLADSRLRPLLSAISSSHCRRHRPKYKWMTPYDD